MTKPLFSLDLGFWAHGFWCARFQLPRSAAPILSTRASMRFRDVLALTEEKAEHSEEHKSLRQIGLAQAIATIMVMDVVFSIDSVITAVGLCRSPHYHDHGRYDRHCG